MKNMLETIVDTLLDLFINPDTGYLVRRGDGLSGIDHAISLSRDKELTPSKIDIIKQLVKQIELEMSTGLSITMFDLKARIDVLQEYFNNAEVIMKDKRDRLKKDPAEADALLDISKSILEWIKGSDAIKLLYIVMNYQSEISQRELTQSESKDQPKENFKKNREDLEASFISDMFMLNFTVKLDALRHNSREKTGYARLVPDYVAEELLNELPIAINSLHEYFIATQLPISRNNKLIESIRALQHVATECLYKFEGKRYSLLPDIAAYYLPSITPSFVVSKPNEFLTNMAIKLEGYNNSAKTLQVELKIKEAHLSRVIKFNKA